MKVVGIRTKPDVVVTKIPPHKLFPKTNSCESFTSSEEEGDTQEETQDKGAQKGGNGKYSKGHHESKKKKGRDSDTPKVQDSHQDRNKEESTDNHTEENGAETGGIQEANCDTVVNGDKVNDPRNTQDSSMQNQEGGGNEIGINAESEEKSIPNGNCDENSSKQEDSSSVLKGDKSSDMEEPGQSEITTEANKLSLKNTWWQQGDTWLFKRCFIYKKLYFLPWMPNMCTR